MAERLALVPDPPVVLKALNLEERELYAPAIRAKYASLNPFALYGRSPRGWDLDLIRGEVVLVETTEPLAAVCFVDLDGQSALTHVVKWGSLPQKDWHEACRDAARYVFGEYPSLLRIEAKIPVSLAHAKALAEAMSMVHVGVIPDGGRVGTEVFDLDYYVLTRRGVS